MMDERRRFQIALGGVAACVLIAAMFVSSAPPLEYRSVMGGQRTGRSLETHIVELVRQCSQLGATA